MANIRVKDLDTKASFASDDEILMDSPSGTGTMLRDAFIAAVASQIVAAPSTYKIATLDASNKLTSSQDPSQSVSYLGGHDVVTNTPTLVDGTGTAGDTYYVTNPGTRNYGSGNITAAEGDALVYSGSVWQLVEGIANILDGISTAATARTTLEVNSIDEDAEATVTKLVSPALYFPASSSYIETSDDAKQSFGDGTTDRAFGLFVKFNAATLSNAYIICKGTTSDLNEYGLQLRSDGKLRFYLRDNSVPIDIYAETTDVVISADQWYSVVVTVDPTSASTARADDVSIYVNGQSKAVTASNQATYVAMEDVGSASLLAGAGGGTYFKGLISGYQIQNRALSSTEASRLSKVGQLPFADEWGGANGGNYTSLFTSDSTDSWVAATGALSATETHDSDSDNLVYTVDNTSSSNHRLYRTLSVTTGRRYRVEYEYFIPTANDVVDGFIVQFGAGNTSDTVATATVNAWTERTVEDTWDGSDSQLRIYVTDGGSLTVSDAGGDDKIAIRNVKVTEIGTLADFRAEDYNESASKLLDRSSNNFVGVGTSVTLTGNQRHISADTIDLKNLPTSSAGLSAGEVWSNGGVLTVV